MKKIFIFSILAMSLFVLLVSGKCTDDKNEGNAGGQDEYVCLPCGASCDSASYKSPGRCSHCSMDLVKKSSITHTDVQPQELCSFITKAGDGNVLLLDVRTPAEFEGRADAKFGRLNNAINIPIQELDKRMSELDAWKNKQIIVYCSHSHRSPRASYMLSQKGFAKVTNMLGGMAVWKSSVKDEKCDQQLYIRQ